MSQEVLTVPWTVDAKF